MLMLFPGKSTCRPVASLSAALVIAVCTDAGDRQSPGEDLSTQDAVVRDSAGIRIIESSGPAWNGDGWMVADTPSVVIGRRRGDERYLLGWVNWRNGAVVLRDGRIAVLDGRSAQIRVYSAEGEHIEDWGRRGEGPGEFNSYPAHIFPYRGDSILVSEETLQFSVFDDAGRFGRRATPWMRLSQWYDLRDIVDRGIVRSAGNCCEFLGPLPTGALLLSTPEMIPNTGSGMKRSSIITAVVPDTGGVADSVGVFDGGLYRPGAAPGGLPGGFHFQPSFSVAVGNGGYHVTEGNSYSIDAYDANGRLARIIRLGREPRPVTDEVKAAYEAELREELLGYGDRLEGGSPDEAIERRLSIPYPPHLPTFESLHVDPEGNIWARQERYGAADDTDEFFVFAADGRYLGIVEVPANLWVFQIGSDFILAQFRDELDVVYVHLYRIEK